MSTRTKKRTEELNPQDVKTFEDSLKNAPTVSFYDNETVTVSDAISYLAPQIAKLYRVKHYSPQQIVTFFKKNNAPFTISVKEVNDIIKAYEKKCAEIKAKRKTKKETAENVKVQSEEHISESIKEIEEEVKSDQ